MLTLPLPDYIFALLESLFPLLPPFGRFTLTPTSPLSPHSLPPPLTLPVPFSGDKHILPLYFHFEQVSHIHGVTDSCKCCNTRRSTGVTSASEGGCVPTGRATESHRWTPRAAAVAPTGVALTLLSDCHLLIYFNLLSYLLTCIPSSYNYLIYCFKLIATLLR